MSDLAAALDVVGARWALLVVDQLLDGPQRYGDLQRALGVPTNMLATRLRELEAAGVLTRLPLRHNTRAYALTDRGLALREAIGALGRWGAEDVVTDRPEVVCLCGSARFMTEMRTANRELTSRGVVVLAPSELDGPPAPEQKAVLDAVHLRRIELADRVLVVNPGGYVGESTRSEIAHARALGKPVDFTEPR